MLKNLRLSTGFYPVKFTRKFFIYLSLASQTDSVTFHPHWIPNPFLVFFTPGALKKAELTGWKRVFSFATRENQSGLSGHQGGTNKGGIVAATNELSLDTGISDLLDAGLHFGHQSKRWNPKMKRFIFGKRNGIYIVDLTKTLAQLKEAQQFIYNTVAGGKQVVFIGTKKACQEVLKEAATQCG